MTPMNPYAAPSAPYTDARNNTKGGAEDWEGQSTILPTPIYHRASPAILNDSYVDRYLVLSDSFKLYYIPL